MTLSETRTARTAVNVAQFIAMLGAALTIAAILYLIVEVGAASLGATARASIAVASVGVTAGISAITFARQRWRRAQWRLLIAVIEVDARLYEASIHLWTRDQLMQFGAFSSWLHDREVNREAITAVLKSGWLGPTEVAEALSDSLERLGGSYEQMTLGRKGYPILESDRPAVQPEPIEVLPNEPPASAPDVPIREPDSRPED